MDKCPYKGLVAYREEDARYFFGRDTERRIIVDNLLAARLTVLYGPSGAGKSSVLRAGVATHLQRDPDYALVIFDSWQDDPVLGLESAIRRKLAGLTDLAPKQNDSPQGPLLDLLESYAASAERTLLLVLDQFEAYFQYHPRDASFASQFAALVSRRHLPIHFLLSIREDSLSVLDQLKSDVPGLWDNRLSITFLSRQAAREAIVKPLARFNEDLRAGKVASQDHLHAIEIDGQVADQVVEEIVASQGDERDEVQAPYLQLVMTRWWEREVQSDSRSMRSETLQDLGGVKTIVERYLDDTLATFSPEEKVLTADCFRDMVTPTGRKIAQTISELAARTHVGETVSPESLESLLEKLHTARVLASVPPPRGSPPNEKCYEFAHDVIAKAAFEWRKQFRQAQKLAEAQQKEAEAKRTAEAQTRQARKLRVLVFALGAALLVALGSFVFSLWQRAVARAGELVASSIANESIDPELSVILAAQGVAATWPWFHTVLPEAEDQLHDALLASHIRLTLSGHSGILLGVAWSPDGRRLATASADSTAKVWDAHSGQQLLTLRHTKPISAVAWSPDAKRLATGSDDTTAKVWDAETGKELLTISGHTDTVLSIAWSPDGTRLATASKDNTARVWDAASGQQLLTLRGHSHWIYSVAWSPDGSRLATSSADQTAKVWDAHTAKLLLTLTGPSNAPKGFVSYVAWSPDSKRLATAHRDNIAKIWDAESGKELQTLTGHNNSVMSLAWSPDGKHLATASWDRTAKIWDAEAGSEVVTLYGHAQNVSSAAWSPDGNWLATASWDKTAKLWDASSGQELLSLHGHNGLVLAVAWSPDSKQIGTASADKTAKVWDANTGKESFTLRYDGPVHSLAWSPDGKRLAAGGGRMVKVWNATGSQQLMTLSGQTGPVASLAWSPDGKRLAIINITNVAKVWDTDSAKESLILRGHNAMLTSVAWSPDAKRLATASADSTAKVWDAATGKELLTLRGHTAPFVTSVAWSPDGKRLATTSRDNTAKVWEAATGRELLTLTGHIGALLSVAWSPDGKRLATASEDHTARVWDAKTGEELITLSAHKDKVLSVAWSPDGKRLATASFDTTVQIYAMDIHDLMNLARQRVTAHPSDEGCKKYLHVATCPPVPKVP